MAKSILHVFGRMNRGGAELRTVSLMDQLADAGAEFSFLTLSGLPGSLDAEIERMGGRVYRCPLNPFFPVEFWKILRSGNFDVVHSHVSMVSGAILSLAALAGIRQRICHLRNTHDSKRDGLRRRIRNGVLRMLLRLSATDIVAVSVGVMRARWGENWETDDRCTVIYNGFDCTEVPKDEGRGFWESVIPEYDGSEVLIHVGRMATQKNHQRVARIFSEFFRKTGRGYLVLAGREQEPVKSEVQSFVVESGLVPKVIFLGEIVDVYAPLRHANCMVFPSSWEGFPGAVAEAAMVGTPVVATDLPGCREIQGIVGGVSLVARDANDETWVSAIESVLEFNADTRAAQQQAFRCSELTISACASRFRQLYGVQDCQP